MAAKRTVVTIVASSVGVAAVAVGAVAFAAQDDPSFGVEAVTLDAVDVAEPADDTAGTGAGHPSGSQQVAALDTVEGTVERRDDDSPDDVRDDDAGEEADDLYVGAVELEFGPEAWVRTAGPSEDFDGDGSAEDLRTELEGLVGQSVTALVRLDDDGDEGDVYVLNDVTYRDSAGAPAPWEVSGAPAGDAASTEEVSAAAVAAVGEGARVTELDPETAGEVAWEADVVDVDGREHTVLLSAAGEVLDTHLDD